MSRLLRMGLGRKSETPSASPALAGRPAADDEDEFHDTEEAQLHPDAHEEGGLAFNNKELLEKQRSSILELVKTLGKKLLTGSLDLINVSLPVAMFEPRSYLEKLADVWVYPRFLDQAAHAEDPVERMTLVVTWFIAGLQHAFQSWRKPFNPILGETWEAGLDDGSQIYMEQISHHPPISAFQMFGPGGLYRFSGLSEPSVSYKANAIKTSAKGGRRFDFPDGMCINITYPHYMMRGRMFRFCGQSRPATKFKANAIKTKALGSRAVSFPDGSRIEVTYPNFLISGIMATAAPRADLVGTARFVDPTHRLCCEVHFGRIEGATHPLLERSDSFAAELFSYTSPTESPGEKKQSRSGFGLSSLSLRLGGSSNPGQGEDMVRSKVLGHGNGNWLSHFDWQGQRMWTLTEEQPARWQPRTDSLPSDCRRRHDLVALQQGQDPKQAQATKELLENLQRADAKLRKSALDARST